MGIDISEPHDHLEVEAEQAAQQVIHGHYPTINHTTPAIQREKANTITPGASPAAPSAVHSVVQSAGTPLDSKSRSFMEARFGRDFSGVRIHSGADAHQAAEQVQANAFTYGPHIAFAAGQFQPGTMTGNRLLAHELAHVVQQQAAGSGRMLQREVKKAEPAPQNVTGVSVYLTEDILFGESVIVFSTPSQSYSYKLDHCSVPVGSYDTTVSVKGSEVRWDFGKQLMDGQEYQFAFKVRPDQQNPATLFHNQKKVRVEVQKGNVATPEAPTPVVSEIKNVATRVSEFKSLVKAAGQARMASNRSALADWQAFLDQTLTKAQAERIVYAQEARDLQVRAVHQGSQARNAYEEAVSTANPIRRFKAAGQVEGRYRACTGCHLENQAQQLEKETPGYLKQGREWTPTVDVLQQYAADEQKDPIPRPGFAKPLPAEGMPKEFQISNPQLPNASAASAALAKIQPFLRILGPGYYDVLPGNLLVTHPTPEAVLQEVATRIATRRADYAAFSKKIGEPGFDYLTLRPIVRELLPLQDDEVRQAIDQELATAQAWDTVEQVVLGGVTLALILLAIFPPTSALGVSGVIALEAAAGATAVVGGVRSLEQGYLLSLGKGAHDVLDPEQQEAATMMMAMGAFTLVLGAIGLKGAAGKGMKLLRGGPAAATGAAGTTGKLIDGLEGEAGGNRIVITEISGGSPKVKVTAPDGKVLYDGLLKDMPQAGFGVAKGAPAAGEAAEGAGLQARQRAAAWHELAAKKEAEAVELEARVAAMKDAAKAAKFKAQAEALRKEAGTLRQEAGEFASGARSPTADLPGPEDVDSAIERLTNPGSKPQNMVRIPLSKAERTAADLPRLERALMRTPRGRVVFRVEGSGSRTLLNVGPAGQITTTPGTVYLNFGSLERALEFLAKRGPGARIVAFEVEEAWVQSLRSGTVPEGGTKFLKGQPRIVDVRFANDQMEIPESLLPEMEKFIVPDSAKVLLTQ